MIVTNLKKWAWVAGSSLVIGMFIGGQSAYYSIVQDCKIMGMFRYGDAPLSCVYHLVNVTVDSEQIKDDKKKK